MARSAVSLAALYSLLRPPRAPLAACMIFFFRAWWATPPLTRGMGCPLRLKQTDDAWPIGRADEIALFQAILSLPTLLGQNVTVIGVPAPQLPRPGGLEALHSGPLGFLLWHL